MKICTITCHRVYNYGASLQAYALQNYLEGKGHTVKIIDYRPWYLNMRYNFWFIAPISRMYSVASRFWIIRFIYCLLKRRDALKNYGRKRAFDNFTQQYLRLTDRSYNTLDSLKNMPPLADLYIAGSDQIWNSNYNNGRDPAFYLDFGSINIKRASYAASFAINAIQEDRKPFVKNQLKKFDYISVRERTGLEILQNLGINDAFLVNDPVFLLDKEKWLHLLNHSRKYKLPCEDFILLYDFVGDERIEKFVKVLSVEKNLKIVSVNDFEKRKYADINISNAGPLEFLNLIRCASCIVSNSFHATAFSVILEREFYVFSLQGHDNSTRMSDFLATIHLKERFNPCCSSNKNIDYLSVNSMLAPYIQDSYSFLDKVLND